MDPTVLLLDSDGSERHRFEGYLPAPDFLAQLKLGLAHAAKARGDWAEAEHRYREIANDPTAADAAPEALYWAGVAKYKASGDPGALASTAHLSVPGKGISASAISRMGRSRTPSCSGCSGRTTRPDRSSG